MQNKNQFIETITEVQEGLTKKAASEMLDTLIDALQLACKRDGGVKIVGVGEVVVKETKASSGTMNGVDWEKPAGQTIKAKLSKSFIEKTLEV